MLRPLVLLVPLGACSLYFGDSSSNTPPDAGAVGDSPPSETALARPCIHTLVAGGIGVPLGPAYVNDVGIITYTCTGTAPVIETVVASGPGIQGADAESNWQHQFTRTVVEDLDGYRPLDMIAVFSPMMWIFSGSAGNRVTFDRGFNDIWIGDLDGDGMQEFVAAGDNALRVSSAYSQTYGYPLEVSDETELATGKPFTWIAVGDFGGSSALDILYVTDGGEIGLMTQTTAMTFTTRTLAQVSGGSSPAFAIADVDGDGKPDVAGAAQNLWIYSTRTKSLYTWPGHGPKALAPGRGEVVFADSGTIYRASIDNGALHAQALFADDQVDALAVGDLDGNGQGDILALHHMDASDSTVVRYAR